VDLKLHLPFNEAVEYMCLYPHFAHVASVQLYTDCQQARLVSSLYCVLPSVVSLDLSGCVPEAVVVALGLRVPSGANVVPLWSSVCSSCVMGSLAELVVNQSLTLVTQSLLHRSRMSSSSVSSIHLLVLPLAIKPEVDVLLQYHKLTGIVRSIERVLWPPTSPAFYHDLAFY
jgi:hypothetical protein